MVRTERHGARPTRRTTAHVHVLSRLRMTGTVHGRLRQLIPFSERLGRSRVLMSPTPSACEHDWGRVDRRGEEWTVHEGIHADLDGQV